jgi:glycosyltransferase involved in cell wall biosynthesis
MRILQLIPSLGSGGAEKYTVELANKLSLLGNEITLVQIYKKQKSYQFFELEVDRKIKYFNLGVSDSRQFNVKSLIKLIKIIIRQQPTVIHSHLNPIYSILLSLFFIRKKFVHTFHSQIHKEELIIKGKNYKRIFSFFIRYKLIQPIVVSFDAAVSFQNYFGYQANNIIENGVSAVRPSSSLELVREELQELCCNKKIFTHIGRYAEVKNQKMLVEAFKDFNVKYPETFLLLLGSNYPKELVELIDKSGCSKYLGEKSNVGDYLLMTDAFCLSSLYEGLPISLIQALSAGCVPICTPAGGILDVIENAESGFISEGFTTQDYSNALEAFYLFGSSIGKESLKTYFKKQYSIDKNAFKVIEIYKG